MSIGLHGFPNKITNTYQYVLFFNKLYGLMDVNDCRSSPLDTYNWSDNEKIKLHDQFMYQ